MRKAVVNRGMDKLFQAFYTLLQRSGIYLPTDYTSAKIIDDKLWTGCRFCHVRHHVRFYPIYDNLNGWPVLNAAETLIICKQCDIKFNPLHGRINMEHEILDEDVRLFIEVLTHARDWRL